LRMIDEVGLERRLERHRLHAAALCAGLLALGLRLFVEAEHRVASVTTVLAPPEVSSAVVKQMLLDEFNLEIGGGLGEYADHMWRIGIMGHSAQQSNVMLLLAALEHALKRQGFAPHASGISAAEDIYRT
jgi:alanine-glyoxylate transaminase/serine-glyoxylate transaminase/serine-pyruvate transaminase